MKVVDRSIFPFQEEIFFSPIRDKIDYARIVVLSARLLLINPSIEGVRSDCSMKLIVDRMSRLFFYKKDKFFSVAFPFTIILEDSEVIELTSYAGINLDSRSISGILAILDSANFRLNPSLIDFYIEPNSIETTGISLLEEIFMFEPSYIRYDMDPALENGKLHPLNHLDINYSQYSTFKLGLKSVITKEFFENLQNTKTECSYITEL